MQKKESRRCKKIIRWEKKILIRKKQENSLNKIVSKRLIFVVLILISISFSLFAKNDDNKTKNQLFAVKTKYFEIIYPQECRKSAEILFENADKIYLEVADQYGLTPSFSMPIVLLLRRIRLMRSGHPHHIIILSFMTLHFPSQAIWQFFQKL